MTAGEYWVALKLGFKIDINEVPVLTYELIKMIEKEVNEKEKKDIEMHR